MGSYIPLLIAPLLCVPVQHLYVAAGQRYDLGPATYIATGTFATAFVLDPGSRPQIGLLLLLLAIFSASVLLIRTYLMAYGSPNDFTLFTFGQLWAVPALIGYEIDRQSSGGISGIYIPSLRSLSPWAAAGALAGAIIMTAVFRRSSLALRLVAFTESPSQYSLVFGSPANLAWKVELSAFVAYLLAGVAFRFAISDISSSMFSTESIWCLLSASVIPRRLAAFVIAGPVIMTWARLLISSFIDPRYSSLLVYFLLAVCLAVLNLIAKQTTRETVS